MKKLGNAILHIVMFIMLMMYGLFGTVILKSVQRVDNPMEFILPFFVFYVLAGMCIAFYYIYAVFVEKNMI